ncbi:hypothetical protein [Roseomonas harenae]|uniref:hypothetical protein n=1 Tax=Muricoccus harenae TaxID=2692566 RepID=UPI001331794B|nr:hypothetical protein [Roseomonas harenae]
MRLVEETAQRTWAAVERAQAEAALLEREERLRLIVENARDHAIFTADSGGRIDTWLPGAAGVFNRNKVMAVGRPTAMTFAPEGQERGEPSVELATAGRRASRRICAGIFARTARSCSSRRAFLSG